jgi:hypothetical protein
LQRWDKNGEINMVEVLKDKGKQNVYFTTQPPSGNEPYARIRTAFTNESWLYYVPATESRAGFDAYEMLLPYPQTELDVNPNIVQNDGWAKIHSDEKVFLENILLRWADYCLIRLYISSIGSENKAKR